MFSTSLDSQPLPARGLFCSLGAHVLFLVATLAVPWNYWLPAEAHLVTMSSQIRQEEALVLPELAPTGAGSPAAPAHNSGQGELKKSAAPATSAEAKTVKGVVYQGPQPIVSNPPHPDNYIQTIRQPDRPATPRLPAPLAIPPMISIAPVKPVLAPPAPQPEPTAPPFEAVITPPLSLPQQLPKVEAPKLPLPASSAEISSLNAVATAPAAAAMPKLAPAPVPPAMAPNGTHNILVVDAVPSANAPPSAIPPGELHGAFTVSPTGSTSAGQAGGGTAAKGEPGIGSATGAGTGSLAGEGNKAAGGSGSGTPALAGAGAGAGTGNGNGSGGKDAAGNGSATGTGHGSGTGTAKTGNGRSPFPDIMIQGGSSGSGSGSGRASGRESATTKPQSSYGITIVASGASGGGFKDYGIFRNGVSYTVYLDMADAGLHGPNWAMQYGPDLRPSADPSDPPPPAHGYLQPPYAIAKTIPHFTPEAARRGRGGTIVVFGVINPKGKWEGLRVMQTPDPALNPAVLNALANWTFKPAELDGTPVSVKCLLGVVVNSVPVE
jgi:TonB family protein